MSPQREASWRHRVCRLTIGAAVGAALLAPAGAQELTWPLELKPALSSTFGETRSTAFHAGIDLKTWGRTGYPVRAVDDGWIVRARTSPWGYGRALYQKLPDGRIAVYAHLESFFAPLQERIVTAQRDQRQYSVQLWFEQDEIPVRRGQVIAATGQSGAGPPHLHLEIRDDANVPQNPLAQGLGPVADTTPPTIRRLAIWPLSAESLVDGGHDPVVVSLGPGQDGRLTGRTVRVWGRVGLAVDSHDRADLAPNRMAAWQHELLVDGASTFRSTYERVSYADGHLVALDRLRPDPDLGAFAALFRRPGNRLSFYDGNGGDGVLWAGVGGLEPGAHEIVVAARDIAGNETRAHVTLEARRPPRLQARLARGAGGGWFVEADVADEDDSLLTVEIRADGVARTHGVSVGRGPFTWEVPDAEAWSVTARDAVGQQAVRHLRRPAGDRREPFPLEISVSPRTRHVVLTVTAARAVVGTPTVSVRATGAGSAGLPSGPPVWLRDVGPSRWVGVLDLDGVDADHLVVAVTAHGVEGGEGRGSVRLSGRALTPAQARDVDLLEGDVTIHGAEGSAYEPLYPQAIRFDGETSEGLRLIGPAAEVGPADAAFDERARISLRIPEGAPTDGLGVYADDGAGRWVFIGADTTAGRLSAAIRAFGRFALLVDGTPPAIDDLLPAEGTTTEAMPRLSARIHDAGSGIGAEEDIVVELNGVRLIAEYDPEADRVIASPDAPLAPGRHRLRLAVTDAAGNTAQAERSFVSR